MFAKPVIAPRAQPNGHRPPLELSVASREPKNPVKAFLAAKSSWLLRAQQAWLERAGLASTEELGTSSASALRNGE